MLEILKSIFWVGSATLMNLLVWVVAGKAMALMLGPAGVGLYGLLRQFAQNVNVVATFNGATTLVQGLASREEAGRPSYARHVAMIFLALTFLVGAALALGGPWLSRHLLGEQVPAHVLAWMLIPLAGMSLSAYFLGLLNGYRHLKALVLCQALGPLAVLALIVPIGWLIKGGGVWGYSIILGVPYLLVGSAAGWVGIRRGWLAAAPAAAMRPSFRQDSRHFFSLSVALLVGGLATTGLQFFLNGMVARSLGLSESGQFWVAWSLSMTYVTVLLSSFGAYYLPSLSGAVDPGARAELILAFTRIAILAMPLMVVFVIVFKGELVTLLFSRALLPSLTLFRWMLIGDFLKVLSWVWAFPMLAFAEGKRFATFEIATNLGWGLLAWLAFRWFPGIEVLGQVFVAVYLCYGAATLVYLTRVHGIRLPFRLVLQILSGLAVILWASFLYWNPRPFSALAAAAGLLPALINLWFALTVQERSRLLARLGVA